MTAIQTLIQRALRLAAGEPAVVGGVIATAADAVLQGGWHALVPLVLSVVVRHFVSPAKAAA